VSGVVDWHVGSIARQSWKRGTADYQFEVVLLSSGPLIRLETSTVTQRK
jgi:hypothetical protein